MKTGSRSESLRGVRTRFNARSFALVAMSILLYAGIAGSCAGPGTAPGAFALSSPENGATGVWPPPTLTWTDAVGEMSYTVDIDNENTFSPPLVYQNTGVAQGTTSFVAPSGVLAGRTTYYWRVTATNLAGSTIASNAPFSFTALTSGELAPGFGRVGVVTSDPSAAWDFAFDVAIDSTAMYVVGCDYSPEGDLDSQWRIEKRSLVDGCPVSRFGTGGVVTSNSSTFEDWARGIAIDSTAMYVVGFDHSPGGLNSQWRIEKRSLVDGSLVTGFGAGGVVTTNPSTGYDEALAIAIDSTAMYVVGYDESPEHIPGQINYQWRIEKRSLTNGGLVPGFGAGGVVTNNPSTGYDEAFDIAVDSTAMYVVGYDHSPGGSNSQWRIEKRNLATGNLVPGFGTGGVVTSNPTTSVDEAFGIAIDSTAMYAIGYDWSPENAQWRIEKRNLATGNLVPGFGTNGVVTRNPSTGSDAPSDIAIDSTAMYVVGSDYSPGNSQWRIEKRSLADGSVVSGFGADGVVTGDYGTCLDAASGIAIDSSAMYVVGRRNGVCPDNYQWRVEKRSLMEGSLVLGFGAGAVTSDPSTVEDRAAGIAIDSTAMYVVGWDESPGNFQWRIEKRSLADGSLATGFGEDGVIISNPDDTYDDIAYAIAIDSTALYVIGYDTSPGNSQWRIEKRNLTDGSLVTGFGTDGVVTSNPSPRSDLPFDIAIDSTAMYVVGRDDGPEGGHDPQWRIEKRSLTDGSLVPGFGTGGVVISNPAIGFMGIEAALGIAIDSEAMYVVGYDQSQGNAQWRIEKRSLADGSLVSGFGTDGVVTRNPSPGIDLARNVAILSTAMYVVGSASSPEGGANYQWRIEKRSLADGNLVPGFGPHGVITGDYSAGGDMAYDIAIDSTAMYVVGYDESPGNGQWRIEKRSFKDASLLAGFGAGGVVTGDYSTGDDEAYAIAIDSTAMYVVGWDASPGDPQWRIEKRVK